ncbi:uncharacterized protein KQ657_001358 [Scheffersomyces spartinae]|uniref:C3H1-type domain-containing protein n=1 Tax=Scheffersomyces spartinae TaxID=45513 RepID=A0A9P7V7X9_9ASCO|nr:uncharacterized protein KQ657_001358 [Scheffersomyces spartinae]KAG7192901.1 hypothetical protein KQ657_001358 [Scheffersomyces spartinae]
MNVLQHPYPKGNSPKRNSSATNPMSFDLTALESLLPAGNGTPTRHSKRNNHSHNHNGSAGNGSNSNKNLSHVPCKFYKQGICQAGNSCPFSHNLDGTLAADKLPCKYFQKGNCKFGLKCALAHFLPDGTKVNSRNLISLSPPKSELNHSTTTAANNNNNNNNINNSISNNNSLGPSPGPVAGGATIVFDGSSSHISNGVESVVGAGASAALSSSTPTPSSTPNSASAVAKHSCVASYVSPFTRRSSSNLNAYDADYYFKERDYTFQSNNNVLSKGNFHDSNQHPINTNAQYTQNSVFSHLTSIGVQLTGFQLSSTQLPSPTLIRSYSTSNATPPTNYSSSSINNMSSFPMATSTSSQSSFHSPNYINNTSYKSFNNVFEQRLGLTSYGGGSSSQPSSFQETSPTYGSYSLYLPQINGGICDSPVDGESESAIYEEDMLPSSLGNLILSPKEQQRRDSRSQSGTLFSRPNLESLKEEYEKTGHPDNDVFHMD